MAVPNPSSRSSTPSGPTARPSWANSGWSGSGPLKPSASSASCAGSTRSVPARASRPPSAHEAKRTAASCPSGPGSNPTVTASNTRPSSADGSGPPATAPDSSCEVVTRYTFGWTGQGCPGARRRGGRGLMSNWVTAAAPWRSAVPRQSAAVSPPPTITTRLPSADSGEFARSPSSTRFAQVRYSIAGCTPGSRRPGTAGSRWAVAPTATTTASYSARSHSPVTSRPAHTPVRNSVPSDRSWSSRRSSRCFSSRNGGIP